MNASRKSQVAIDALFGQILQQARAKGSLERKSWMKPERDLKRLAGLDYVRVIRRTLGYRELCGILKEGKKIWPTLNEETLRKAAPVRLSEIAKRLRIHLQAKPYDGPEGLAMRGFYVTNTDQVLKRPLIYLNTAHHPGAVAATWCHELGHYAASKATGHVLDGVHFYTESAHSEHLDDPSELAADIMVSLAAYPRPLASKIFAVPWDWGLVARADLLPDEAFARIRAHVQKICGIDFVSSVPLVQSFHYLAGMIHYAKLRWALLVEYDL